MIGRVFGIVERFIETRPRAFVGSFMGLWLALHTFVLLGAYEGFIDFETLKYGYLAKDFSEGLIASSTAYQYFYREGAALAIGPIVWPFFKLLGPSMFALYLAGAWFMAIGTWPWLDLARRIAGPKGAIAMALLLLLPFPFYLRMTIMLFSIVTHLGTIIFSGYFAWFIYRGFFERSMKPEIAMMFAGLVVGIGCWWAFSFWAIAVGAGLGVLALRAGAKITGIFAVSVLPGLGLLWTMCVSPLFAPYPGGIFGAIRDNTWRAVLVASEGDGTPAIEEGAKAAQLVKLVTYHFPRAAGFVKSGAHPENFVWFPSLLYYLGFGLCILFVLYTAFRQRKDPEGLALYKAFVLLSLPVPTYLFVYLTSGIYADRVAFDQYRYFLPIVPYTFLLVAFAHARLQMLPTNIRTRASLGGYAVLVVLGLWSVSNVFSFQDFPTPIRTLKGYNLFFVRGRTQPILRGLQLAGRTDYQPMAVRLGMSAGLNPDNYKPTPDTEVPGLSPWLWNDYWEGFGTSYRFLLHRKQISQNYLRWLLVEAEPDKVHAIIRGMVLGDFRYRDVVDPLDWPKVIVRYVRKQPNATKRAAALAAVYSGLGEAHVKYSRLHKGEAKLWPRPRREAFVRGMAVGFARDLLSHRVWPRATAPMHVVRKIDLDGATFRDALDKERRRIEAIRRRHTDKAPLDLEKVEFKRPMTDLPMMPMNGH